MTTAISPVRSSGRTQNPLRPNRLDEVIGQPKAKALLTRAIDACYELRQPLDHALFTGAAGTGKSTFSHVLGNELQCDVYEVEAPVALETLYELRTTMRGGDILRIEEIHLQAAQDRRGRQAGTLPENLYGVMEDRVLTVDGGVLEFPHITIIGTTTDEGRLPDAFISRFPLRPVIEEYTAKDMLAIASYNAEALGLQAEPSALRILAGASRSTPRALNNLMKNAAMLAAGSRYLSDAVAHETLDMNSVTTDGLTKDMADTLRFLYTKARHQTADGSVKYQASVNTIATITGHSRDSKAVVLRIEPYLIQQGFVQVTPAGRRLTDLGVERARQLV